MISGPEWQQLIEGLRNGETLAEHRLWDQFGPLLHRLAEKNVGPQLRCRVDPEDIVLSACRTFLRRAQVGQFELDDGTALWRLLCAITLTKIRERARFHTRDKRDYHREQPIAGAGVDWERELADAQPSVDAALEFAEELRALLDSLGETERRVAQWKLDGLTNREVAERLRSSERTVERTLHQIKQHLARCLDAP